MLGGEATPRPTPLSQIIHFSFFVPFFSLVLSSRRWSWVTVRRPRLWPYGCCCLCPNLTNTASMKWIVTMVTPWSTRSLSSPNALWDIICWKWVTPWTLCCLFTRCLGWNVVFFFYGWIWSSSTHWCLPQLVLVTSQLLDPLIVCVTELRDGRSLKWILPDAMKHWAPAKSHSLSDSLCPFSLWRAEFLYAFLLKRNMLCYSCWDYKSMLSVLLCKEISVYVASGTVRFITTAGRLH